MAVEFRDTGGGMTKEQQQRAFKTVLATTKAKGTGLGLATVKHNVELYGGSVHLESELGKGARFRLVFPAKTLLNLETQV